jgi:HSP20 family molecular chaperone IbpA
MNNKLLLAIVISAATTSSAISSPDSVGESVENLFKAMGQEFKKLPSMILPHAGSSLKLVSAHTDPEYRYELAIPGKNENHVTAKVDHGTHTITVSVQGDVSEKKESTKDGIHTMAITHSAHAFNESFKAPRDAQLHGIEITVKDGLLTLIVPKKTDDADTTSQHIIPINKTARSRETSAE